MSMCASGARAILRNLGYLPSSLVCEVSSLFEILAGHRGVLRSLLWLALRPSSEPLEFPPGRQAWAGLLVYWTRRQLSGWHQLGVWAVSLGLRMVCLILLT